MPFIHVPLVIHFWISDGNGGNRDEFREPARYKRRRNWAAWPKHWKPWEGNIFFRTLNNKNIKLNYYLLVVDLVQQEFFCQIWNQTIWNTETFEIQTFWRSDFTWSGYSYSSSPNHLKFGPLKIRTFLSGFQMLFFYKIAPICRCFKWLSFQISDPIQNRDHLFAT